MVNKTYVTTRDMTYNTRRLKAGDEFTALQRDGDLLVKLGRASPAMPKPTGKVAPDALAVARADYEKAAGKRAFHGWDEQELRRKIAEIQTAPIMPPIPAGAVVTTPESEAVTTVVEEDES